MLDRCTDFIEEKIYEAKIAPHRQDLLGTIEFLVYSLSLALCRHVQWMESGKAHRAPSCCK